MLCDVSHLVETHLRAVEGARLGECFGSCSPWPFIFAFGSIHGGLLRTFRVKFIFTGAKKYTVLKVRCIFLPQRRPTFPGGCPPSIIGTTELNYCVRNGYRCVLCVIVTEFLNTIHLIFYIINFFNSFWLSPRPISIGQLNTLLHLHLRPINHIVYMGPYSKRMGYLISGWASRLDAFSVYPFRTWLLCHRLDV